MLSKCVGEVQEKTASAAAKSALPAGLIFTQCCAGSTHNQLIYSAVLNYFLIAAHVVGFAFVLIGFVDERRKTGQRGGRERQEEEEGRTVQVNHFALVYDIEQPREMKRHMK